MMIDFGTYVIIEFKSLEYTTVDEFLKHIHLHLLRKSGGVVEILWKSVMMADADIRPTLMLLGHQISDRSGFSFISKIHGTKF